MSETAIEPLELGAVSPDFKAKDVDERAVSFATWADKAVVFYFGSGRTDGGVRGLRRFESMAKSMGNDAVGFVTILPDGAEELEAARSARSRLGLETRMVQDAGGRIAREFGVARRPFVVVVDKDRVIRATHDRFGALSASSVKASIRSALARTIGAGAVGNAAQDPDADLPSITEYIKNPTRRFKLAEFHPTRLRRIDKEQRQLHVFSTGAPTAWDFDRDGRLDYCFLQTNGVMVLPGNGVGTMVVRLGSNRDGGSVSAACPVEEADGVGWFTILQGWDGSRSSWALALFGKDGRIRWSSEVTIRGGESVYPRGVIAADLDGDGRTEFVAGVDIYRVQMKAGVVMRATQKSYLVVLSSSGEPICIMGVGDDKANIGWMTATAALGKERGGRIFCAISGTLQAFELEPGAARAAGAAEVGGDRHPGGE